MSLKADFDKAKYDIETDKGFHYPLINIMRALSPDKTTVSFNREALAGAGIDPQEFLTAWATGYAKETLLQYDNPDPTYKPSLLARCRTCLTTEGDTAFGNVLPEEIKTAIRNKFVRNGGSPEAP